MRRLIVLVVLLIAATSSFRAVGQYYNTGRASGALQWETFHNDSLRMVYPVGFEYQARRTMFYMDKVRPYVSYGFKEAPFKTPVVLNTQNFFSNGISILTPKRIEIGGIPSIQTSGLPWLKELAAHEYRHMVQYANVNRSTVKVLSWFLGQQATLLATGLVPFWFIEGDAVMFETQMSTFGRGLQPSMTMHYRALGDEILKSKNPDKWFCGAYNDYVPSHYDLGYQMVAYADNKYDSYIGESITRFTADYPFLIFTSDLGLRKYHKTTEKKLFLEAFGRLIDYWDALPLVENSSKIVSPQSKHYTVYSYPLFLGNDKLLVLKKGLDYSSRFVEIDIASGAERTVCHTGIVSTRPVINNGKVLWTEYRQSMFWEQKTGSRVCAMDIGHWKPYDLKEYGNSVLYPVDMVGGLSANVRYHYDGYYSVDIYVQSQIDERVKPQMINSVVFPKSVSIHGLAWDGATASLYYIGLADDGMWIGGISTPGLIPRKFDVKQASYVTLSDLSAGDGMLYFNSIYSGKDEAHSLDIASGAEYRISNSRYGSFSPSPFAGGEFVAMTTYERSGYKVAVQEVEYWDEVSWREAPYNVVNPPTKKWDVASLDDIVFTSQEEGESKNSYKAKRYRKGLHLFDFHSWAPFYFKPDELMSDPSFEDIRIGATVISQNILSNSMATLGYGYNGDGSSTIRGRFTYDGWAPKIGVTVLWNSNPHRIQDPGNIETSPGSSALIYGGTSLSVNSTISLPMLLSSGYRVRWLTPQVQWSFNNSEVIHPFTGKHEYQSVLLSSLQYSESVRRASLDLQPRWGYALRASAAGNPFSDISSKAWSVFGRAYTPGLFLHHGLTFSSAYQQATDNLIMLAVVDYMPKGFVKRILPSEYMVATARYSLPVAYPNWGISGLFFVKRISMSASYDYARYTEDRTKSLFGAQATAISSYGATINIDVAPLRMPDESTSTLSLNVYKPSGNDIYWSIGFSVPL